MTLAWIRQAQGDPGGALEAMGEAGRTALGPGVTGLLNPVPAQRARLLLAQGDVAAADRWTAECGLAPGDEPGYPREPEYLVLARVLIAQDRPAEALKLLETMLAAASGQGRTGSVIEIAALRARRWRPAVTGTPRWRPWASRSPWAARRATCGCLPTRARQWPRCWPGWSRCRRQDAPLPAVSHPATWPRCCGRSAARTTCKALGGAPPWRSGAMVEHLTGRELEVLVLLAAGMPNPRIAEQLVVTLDTVKKHVSHVLGKLGAANRTEAVTRARQLSLIP